MTKIMTMTRPTDRMRSQNQGYDDDLGNDDDHGNGNEIQVSSQSREMSQSLVVTSQGGLPLHRSSSFHQVIILI